MTMNDDSKEKQKENQGSPAEPPYDDEENLDATMMDLDMKPKEKPESRKPMSRDTKPKEEEEPLEELLKKQKSLLNRLGLRGLFKKDKS